MKTIMKKLRIGILGCGAVAYRWYLKGLCKTNSLYDVVVVCDIRKASARKAAIDFTIPHFCTTKEEMIKHNLDLVVVLTRHKDHYENILYFLKKGIHVYSEKPFVTTSAEGHHIITFANKHRLTVGSAPQVMLSTRNQTVKQLIKKGLIGKVTFVRVSSSNLGPAARTDTNYDPIWFYKDGGSLWSLGIYGLSTLIYILGIPKIVSSFEGIAIRERKVLYGPVKGKKFTVTAPDNVIAMFDFGQNTFCLYDGSYSVATPPKYELEIHGTKGSLLVGGFGGPESVIYVDLAKKETFVGPDDNCHKKWNLSMGVEETVKAILEKREPLTSIRFAYSVIRVIEAMSVSHKEKRHVTIRPNSYDI
jgi:predicted dehydrogenase